MRPVPDAFYPAMLDGIPVDVIDVPFEILVVANYVFPVSTLPDTSLPPFSTALGAFFTGRDGSRKSRLYQSPAYLVVRITLGQGPDAMQVLRQNDNRIDFEGMAALHFSEDLP